MQRLLLIVPVTSLLFVACSSESTVNGSEVEAPAAEAGSAYSESPATESAPAASTDALPDFQAQEGWTTETPRSSMRIAQFRLPKQGDDADDVELVVYHFASSGTVEDNFKRWASQLAQPDGGDSMEVAVMSERSVRGMTVHQFDCSGHFVAEMPPGSGNRVDKPGYRMLGAIIETQRGPFYVKLTGPEGTVEHWKSSYENFLSSI